jgi:hypothetical protein
MHATCDRTAPLGWRGAPGLQTTSSPGLHRQKNAYAPNRPTGATPRASWRQGGHHEVNGRGLGSMGALDPMRCKHGARKRERRATSKFEIEWTTHCASTSITNGGAPTRGIAPNIASYGRRRHHPRARGGPGDPPAHAGRAGTRCARWCRQRMEEGALRGRPSSLIYAPASYASTEELDRACARWRRKYQASTSPTSAGEGDHLGGAVDELIGSPARQGGARP